MASKDGRTLYVAQTDAGRIARVDLASGKLAGSIDDLVEFVLSL